MYVGHVMCGENACLDPDIMVSPLLQQVDIFHAKIDYIWYVSSEIVLPDKIQYAYLKVQEYHCERGMSTIRLYSRLLSTFW